MRLTRLEEYPRLARLRIALVHDAFTQWGGAERVVEVLHGMFPKAPIYTTVSSVSIFPESMRDADIRTSWLQQLPGSTKSLVPYTLMLPKAIESLNVADFDLVISSSSSVGHGVRTKGMHVSYVYNTMRFAWDYETYMAQYGLPTPAKVMGRPFAAWLRRWDRRVAARASHVVPISNTVSGRISVRWLRPADSPIPPPADLDAFDIGTETRSIFLVLSRLQSYKRLDVAVEAANRLRAPLWIAGDGPDRQRLERLAGPTVRFLGRISEENKRALLQRAWALLVPGEEDYGLAPVEANACGTPVVAWNRGGVTETQIQGETGILVKESSTEPFAEAMDRVSKEVWDHSRIQQHALTRDRPTFETRFFQYLDDVVL